MKKGLSTLFLLISLLLSFVTTISFASNSSGTPANQKEYKWRKVVFGQSSNPDKQAEGISGVTAEAYGTASGKINVRAWKGSGKITQDHDGISYYYTTTDNNENFRITADITVNKYLEHDNNDTRRSGQEAFGIMARDVIPLTDKDGEITTDENNAVKDNEGLPVPHESGMVFTSNMVICGGYSGRGYPSDTTIKDYDKYINMNRINLIVREGVVSPESGGKRIGPFAINGEFPKEGNKYRITLKRLTGGLYAECYDYQTGKTQSTTYDDDSFLTVQSDKIYVGFFASRWADIDISNVEFSTVDRATDEKIVKKPKPAKPDIIFVTKNYSISENYDFDLATVKSHGRVTVVVNGTTVANNLDITDTTKFRAKLTNNSANEIIVTYTPDKSLLLTSYEPITIKKTVYCKEMPANTTTLYVAPNGNFEGNGTKESPFDIDTAIGLCQPGQVIALAGGVYDRTSKINISMGDDGTADKPKTIRANADDKAIFDLGGTSAGFVAGGNYWIFENIDIRNSGNNLKAFHLSGSYCIVRNCKFYNNRDTGFQVSRIDGENLPREKWPAHNLIENCESFNNCDPAMINADGFGNKLTAGEGNVYRNCSSHHNVDDGWDCYTKINSGAIGAVILENCVAYKNGLRLNEDGTETPYGAGGHNGFKMGGENIAVNHVLKNCVAYDNLACGVSTNFNPSLTIDGVKSYNNAKSNFNFFTDKVTKYNYTVTNAISYNGGEIDRLPGVTYDKEHQNKSKTPFISNSNYWQLTKEKSVNKAGKEAKESMLKK